MPCSQLLCDFCYPSIPAFFCSIPPSHDLFHSECFLILYNRYFLLPTSHQTPCQVPGIEYEMNSQAEPPLLLGIAFHRAFRLKRAQGFMLFDDLYKQEVGAGLFFLMSDPVFN